MLSAVSYESSSLFKHILLGSSIPSSDEYTGGEHKNEEAKLAAENFVEANDGK
jgi:hypothetical protein